MRLVRFGPVGAERPGLVDSQGKLRDLSALVPDIGAAILAPDALARIARTDHSRLPLITGAPRLGPPVAHVSKFIAIGLNYRDHAEEAGMPIPTEPILFLKAPSCIVGPNDAIVLPRGSVKTDFEAELGIVIGTVARYVSVFEALQHVAGYLVVHDVSERAYQLERGGTWDKGKGCDTFGPIGPWLVTRDEIPDSQTLDIWLNVNEVPMQRGNTSRMIFSCAQLVSYVSEFMTLLPGDIITTGTPPGVGLGRKPSVFLKPGDVVNLGISRLGEQQQTVASSESHGSISI